VAQISCYETGKLYAIITRRITGEVRILYRDHGLFADFGKEANAE
jgi:hypothetical protein